MRAAMEMALSKENEEVRKVVKSTATADEVNLGSGLDVDKKQQKDEENRGNANQWADEAKSRVQFGYDADEEAEKWWADHGRKTIGPLARM
jgi:hypothetical protein